MPLSVSAVSRTRPTSLLPRPESQLRLTGLAAVAAGLLIVALACL